MTSANESRLLSRIRVVCVASKRGVFVRGTKDFHRQMKEPDFRDYHLLLDEHDKQILAVEDDVGARAQHLAEPQEQQLRIRSAQ